MLINSFFTFERDNELQKTNNKGIMLFLNIIVLIILVVALACGINIAIRSIFGNPQK